MSRKPKALYIGNHTVGAAFQNIIPEWDIVAFLPTIDAFWDNMSTGEVSNDVEVVIIMDTPFYDSSGENTAFETLVATLLPHCLVIVVNYLEEDIVQIRQRIDTVCVTQDVSQFDYYVVTKSKVRASLTQIIEQYIEQDKNTFVASILRGDEQLREYDTE